MDEVVSVVGSGAGSDAGSDGVPLYGLVDAEVMWLTPREVYLVEYIEAALAAQHRELVVMDPAEVDDDLVRDMTELLTSMCARLYGKRAAQHRAQRLAEAVVADE